ncbi:MAG: 3-hydroxyacyl-ACP dehydratase FabZ [Sphingomonadaceae bacterium]|nr:3-hydroxyacyl-ACP dehydratase FabZ [Sphingomonadaceae bacterium]
MLGTVEIAGVLGMLPHRYPMLLVDRVDRIVPARSARGLKGVTVNEPFFQGHFPRRPIMAGVLIIEALAQTGGALAEASMGEAAKSKLLYFMAIENAKFCAPVEPGCLLELYISVAATRGRVWKFEARAEVDGRVCTEAQFTAKIADPPASD